MQAKKTNHFKVILSIAKKDTVQAIKDKTTLGVIIGVMLLVLPSQLLPLILQNESTPQAIIFSPDPSPLAKQLAEMDNTSARQVNSLDKVEDEIVSGRSLIIGLVLPEGWTENPEDDSAVIINAYLPHWTSAVDASRLVNHFEDKISSIMDREVRIMVVDDQVHPDENTRGFEVMFILQIINATMTITLVLGPQLIMVEKETHTLDALMVSPANYSDIIIGKGLAASFYGVLGASIVILLNTLYIVHWWLLIFVVISGIILTVLIGLLLGLKFDNFQQGTLILSLLVFLILGPAFIKLILTVNLPPILETILNWLPSGQMADLTLMSLMKTVNLNAAMIGLATLWVSIGLLIGLIAWQIRKEMR
ncbi:MAG: ABC transporter permease [Anaerolineales bacterium]